MDKSIGHYLHIVNYPNIVDYMNSPPYTDRMFRWTLRTTLEKHKLTRYWLAKNAELSMNAVRAMYDGTPTRIDFPQIEKVIRALAKETGEKITAADVFIWEEE